MIAALAIFALPSCDIARPKDGRDISQPNDSGHVNDVARPNEAKVPTGIAVPEPVQPNKNGNQTAKRTTPPKAIPPHRPGPESKALVGKTEEELTKLLGVPSEVRNEPPALVWNYRAKNCSVDVFMYFDVGQESFRSLAYRFYPETRVAWAQRQCLAGIRNARPRADTSN